MKKKYWFRIIVTRDFLVEMKCYTIQNYLNKILACNITEDHSFNCKPNKEWPHVALHCYNESGIDLFYME